MFNKEEIITNFSRSAGSYDQHAILQKEMGEHLLRSIVSISPIRVLDIGCGTGYLTAKLAKRYPRAEVIGIDIAPGMIETAKAKNKADNLRFAIGDGEGLPFEDRSFDLIISNAALQWMDAGKAFAEAGRLLSANSQYFFSTFGPLTLRELKASGFRVNKFQAADCLKELLKERFQHGEVVSRVVEQKFRSVKELVFHLKELGAQSVGRVSRGNENPLKAIRQYKERFSERGLISVTYEVIVGKYST